MLKYLELVFILVAFVNANDQNCSKGPEYWCKNIKTAKECGAFEHCLQTIWTTHKQYAVAKEADFSECNSCIGCLSGDMKECPDDLKLNFDEVTKLMYNSFSNAIICRLADSCHDNVKTIESDNLNGCNLMHPRHKCDNIDNARKCGSFKYCLEYIWSQQKPMILAPQYEKDEGPCGFCIWIFNKLHEILQSNITEFNTKQYLIDACAFLPNKNLENGCVTIINNNFLFIYNLIQNNIDPGIICRIIKLCKDETLIDAPIKNKQQIEITVVDSPDTKIETPYNKIEKPRKLLGSKTETIVLQLVKSNGVGCELCSFILSAARLLKNKGKTNDEILSFIRKQQCSRLGGFRKACEDFIDIDGENLIKELVENNVESSKLCNKMGLCMTIQVTSENTLRFYDVNAKDPASCDLCKSVFTTAEDMMNNQKPDSEILDYIDINLCDKSSGPAVEMCKIIISVYGELVLHALASGLQQEEICYLIGFCPEPSRTALVTDDHDCDTCQFVMSEVAKFITPNTTDAEIDELLMQVCQMFISTEREDCESFIAHFAPVIDALIAKKISVKDVCIQMGFCMKSVNEGSSAVQQKATDDHDCETCEFVMTEVAKFITPNTTDAEIDQLLMQVCQLFISTNPKDCQSFIAQFAPVIDALIAKKISVKDVCIKLGFCKTSVNEGSTAVQQIATQDNNCIMCEFIMTAIAKYITENTTETEIDHVLEHVCQMLPSTIRDECKSFIAQYEPMIAALIAKKISPKDVCTKLGFCKTSITAFALVLIQRQAAKDPASCDLCKSVFTTAKDMMNNQKPDSEILDYIDINLCDKSIGPEVEMCKIIISIYGQLILEYLFIASEGGEMCFFIGYCADPSKNTLIKQDDDCTMCQFVMTEIAKFVTPNTTDAEIDQLLMQVCQMFVSTKPEDCNAFILQFAPVLDALISKKISPKVACIQMRFCKKSVAEGSFAVQQKAETKSECVLCELIMNALKTHLGNDGRLNKIGDILESACDEIMSKSLIGSCKKFIDQYGPMMVVDGEPTETFCERIHFCISEQTVLRNSKISTFDSEAYCDACEYAIEFLKYEINKDKSEAAIENVFENVCKIAPKKIQSQCVSIVETYGTYLVSLILEYANPSIICKKIKLCSIDDRNIKELEPSLKSFKYLDLVPSVNVEKPKDSIPSVKLEKSMNNDAVNNQVGSIVNNPRKDTLECNLCIYVAEVVNSFIKQNKTEKEIIDELEKLCKFLKPPLKNQCVSFIDQYGALVLQLLANDFDPQLVCSTIKLCPTLNNDLKSILRLQKRIK